MMSLRARGVTTGGRAARGVSATKHIISGDGGVESGKGPDLDSSSEDTDDGKGGGGVDSGESGSFGVRE